MSIEWLNGTRMKEVSSVGFGTGWGAPPTVGGTKHDNGKPRMELLSAIALEETAKVLSFGAKKYADNNWRKGIAYTRVLGAILRHTFAYLRGETKDPETGLSHMAHVMCEAMFLLEFEATMPNMDDRYKPSSDTEQTNVP